MFFVLLVVAKGSRLCLEICYISPLNGKLFLASWLYLFDRPNCNTVQFIDFSLMRVPDIIYSSADIFCDIERIFWYISQVDIDVAFDSIPI